MIYKFRIISDEVKDFARELLIGSKFTFLDFHHCLQENLNYDPKQLASFFITNDAWEKSMQITLLDMMDEESDNCITMEKGVLEEYMKGVGQRLLYVYDFFTERSFFIELTEILDISDAKGDPKIIFSHGEPPIQIELGLGSINFTDEAFSDEFADDSFEDDMTDEFDFLDSDEFQDD